MTEPTAQDADEYRRKILDKVSRVRPKRKRAKVKANGDDDAGDETVTRYTLHWHGEDGDAAAARAWLVAGLLPETGVCLVSGQWGTYKTFAVLDLAAAVMAGGSFIEHKVIRRGGVLFIAAEGAAEIPVRLEAVLHTKHPELERAPFAWSDFRVQLVEPDSVEILAAAAAEAAARMSAEFKLPLALIVIDTIVASAGYSRSGDENDAALAHAIMSRLAALSQTTGALVLGVDHFGKTAETGTRGSSAKEGAADIVLALLGNKDISGAVTNTRLALRKSRAGAGGQEFPFVASVVDLGGADNNGIAVTSLVIDWQPAATVKTAKANDGWSKSLVLLRRCFMNVLADHGRECQPFADGPSVRAVDIEIVRGEFYKSTPADGDAKDKQAVRRQAFNRAIKTAQERNVIAVREVDGVTLVWLVRNEGGNP
jgi:hypothetical protein